MRSSLILGVALLLTIATPSIVQASEETCGNLGPGVNACKCGEIVVKAAKVRKPLLYASPEAINEAAVARAAVGRLPVSSGTFSSSSSSSSSGSSFTSSSSASSSSSVGLIGGLIGRSKAYSPFKYLGRVPGKVTSSCGCGKTSESLQVHDLLSSNVEGKVVPSFSPIGDLCYPSAPQTSGKYQVTTKVTPAYPGKIKCVPPIPYEVCVQILNGQIDEAGLRKLGSATGGKLGEYTSNLGRTATRYSGLGGYGSAAGSSAYGYGSYAGYAGVATSSNVETVRGSAARHGSSYESTGDFGDYQEFPEDYSYPRLPADPVSVSLAYKNLVPHTVYYNRRTFVPEDKLAFGHRTVPTEPSPGKKVPDVPEEKLQTLEKPVVELKPVPSVPLTVGAYDEHEEAKLAALEAIERERINQEEIAEQQRRNFITYGDLGYAPINRVPTARPYAADPTGAEDDAEADCGPIGPPNPDYVPGSVVVDQELVENVGEVDAFKNMENSRIYLRHYAGDETSDEEDDSDDSTSGIFARLKSVAQKHGPSCGVAV